MAKSQEVSQYRRFLVFSTRTPDLAGLSPELVSVFDPAERAKHGSYSAGTLLRATAMEQDADFVAVVNDPAALTGGWLAAAANQMQADKPATAVCVTYPGNEHPASITPRAAAVVLDGGTLREIGGFLEAFDGDGALDDVLWRMQARGSEVGFLAGYTRPDTAGQAPSVATQLAVAMTNLERHNAQTLLAGLSLAIVTSPLHSSGVDTVALDLQRAPGGDDIGALAVPAQAISGITTIDDFLHQLDGAPEARWIAQSTRRVSDRLLAPAIGAFIDELWGRVGGQRELIEQAFGQVRGNLRPHLLVVGDKQAEQALADGGWLAEALAKQPAEYRIRFLDAKHRSAREFEAGEWRPVKASSAAIAEWADVIILERVNLRAVPRLAGTRAPLLVDVSHLDAIDLLEEEYPSVSPADHPRGVKASLLAETLTRADHVLARDAEQRDILLGLLAGLNRINPLVYDEDHSLNNLISVVDGDLGSALARWCANPRTAADRVHTFSRTLPKKKSRIKSVVSAPLRAVRRLGGAR